MNAPLPTHWALDLPNGEGVNLPPPVWPLDDYFDWLQERHEERAKLGSFDRYFKDPNRRPVDAPFRLD